MRVFALLLVLSYVTLVIAPTPRAASETVQYDPVSFPDEQGWSRSNTPPQYLAERWLESGCFVQHAVIVEDGPPQIGQQDFYRWYEIPGETAVAPKTFQMRWKVETDGTQQGIPAVAPASIVASGTSGIRFHFTIARDQVRLIDSYLEVYLWDISKGAHAYRMEAEDGELKFWIDEVLVHQDTVPGSYPTPDSVVVFGARAAVTGSTTRWSYIEFGTIPPDADPDDDGDVDLLDFSKFHQCVLASSPTSPLPIGCAMLDSDEDVDFIDFSALQLLFTGGDNR